MQENKYAWYLNRERERRMLTQIVIYGRTIAATGKAEGLSSQRSNVVIHTFLFALMRYVKENVNPEQHIAKLLRLSNAIIRKRNKRTGKENRFIDDIQFLREHADAFSYWLEMVDMAIRTQWVNTWIWQRAKERDSNIATPDDKKLYLFDPYSDNTIEMLSESDLHDLHKLACIDLSEI